MGGLGRSFAKSVSRDAAQIGRCVEGIDHVNGIWKQTLRQVSNPDGIVAENNPLFGEVCTVLPGFGADQFGKLITADRIDKIGLVGRLFVIVSFP